MKTRAFLFLTLLGLTGCATVSAAAQTKKVSDSIRQKVQEKGTVRVIVELAVPVDPHKKLTPTEELTQRSAIATAQKEVLADLAGTKYNVYMQNDRIRGLALELDFATLSILQNSLRIVRVYEDYPLKPLMNVSVPSVGAGTAWQSGFDGTGWHVVVVDSGVDKHHNFFKINGIPVVVVDEACFSFSGDCPNGTTEEAGPGTGVHCTFFRRDQRMRPRNWYGWDCCK